MNTPIYIDSSKARNNFANILNSVFNNKKTYIIKKSGIPVAKISFCDKNNEDKLLDFAGMLSKKEGDKISKMIREGRRDGSRLKKKLI